MFELSKFQNKYDALTVIGGLTQWRVNAKRSVICAKLPDDCAISISSSSDSNKSSSKISKISNVPKTVAS